ncbi:MAG: hypothetical protein ACD_10C00842G0005 [uncultured bacterium]|nr:MAG: hypothetical protein ACD_10C00842G0005 [uncultured bacterium]
MRTKHSATIAGKGSSWHATIRSNAIVTSASLRTLMPARPRPPSAFSTTPASPTRSAKSMTAPRRWTGWSKSKSAGSRSPRLRPPPSGNARLIRVWRTLRKTSSASTSSTPPATLTSPLKSNVRWPFLMALSFCWTATQVWNRKPKPCGVRLTATRFRVSSSSTRWTRPALISSTA